MKSTVYILLFVSVAAQPWSRIFLSPESVREGQDVTVNCVLEKSPPGNITLARVGDAEPLKQALTTHLSLTLPRIRKNYSGEYSCVFQQGQAIGISSVLLSVMYAPEIADESSCTERNGTLACDCLSWGVPRPTIEWPGLRVDSSLLDVTVSALEDEVYSFVTVQKDAGLAMTCVSRNRIGRADRLLHPGKEEAICEIPTASFRSVVWIVLGISFSINIIFLICCINMVRKRLKGKKQEEKFTNNDNYATLDNTAMSPDYDIINRTTVN